MACACGGCSARQGGSLNDALQYQIQAATVLRSTSCLRRWRRPARVVAQRLSCAAARAPQGRGDRWSQLDGDHGAAVTVTTPVGREREAICARWPKEHICVYSRRWDQRGAAAGRQLRRGIRTRLCTGHFGALTNARPAPASPDMLMRKAEARHGVGCARNGVDRL